MQVLLWFKEEKLVLKLLLFFKVRSEKVHVGSITLLKTVKVCVVLNWMVTLSQRSQSKIE